MIGSSPIYGLTPLQIMVPVHSQMRENTSRESEIREVRVRMERELEALQALSQTLSEENTTLRQEKITVIEQMESLRMKVRSSLLSFSER